MTKDIVSSTTKEWIVLKKVGVNSITSVLPLGSTTKERIVLKTVCVIFLTSILPEERLRCLRESKRCFERSLEKFVNCYGTDNAICAIVMRDLGWTIYHLHFN